MSDTGCFMDMVPEAWESQITGANMRAFDVALTREWRDLPKYPDFFPDDGEMMTAWGIAVLVAHEQGRKAHARDIQRIVVLHEPAMRGPDQLGDEA